MDPDQSKNKYINTWGTSFVVLDFIGGEPLLEIDLITEICRYFTKRVIELDHPWKVGYMLSIGTNGVLYFDPKVQAFIDEFKGNTGYYKYQVSLMDGKTRKPIDIIECRYKTP